MTGTVTTAPSITATPAASRPGTGSPGTGRPVPDSPVPDSSAPDRAAGAATAGPLRTHVIVASPIGPLTIVAEAGAIAALYMDAQRHAPDPAAFGLPGDAGDEPFAAAARQLGAYFAGQLTEFDLPLALAGTDFQRTVWAGLRDIPYGQTVSYGELAQRIGRPAASRAVGLANGRNPVAIVVPCHRVIGSDGSMTGYGGGLDRKRFLLALEQRSGG
jgi:methylated-DNA-[protein]-cysteine S-methyltransferase